MKIHYLKTWPEEFESVKTGLKTFDIRINDRGFTVGDILVLEKYDPTKDKYLDESFIVKITYILHGGRFRMSEDMIAMSIEPITCCLGCKYYQKFQDKEHTDGRGTCYSIKLPINSAFLPEGDFFCKSYEKR